jgi:hypothetical protein
VSETEETRRRDEGDHPEVDRSYERDQGGQLPDDQEDAGYDGPDPSSDEAGDGEAEDQGI